MKTLSISALIVAGFLAAAGSGVIGGIGAQTGSQEKEQAKSGSCCANKSTQVAAKTEGGSCCASQQVLATTEVQEKSCDGAGCASGSGCCQGKGQTLASTQESAQEGCPVTAAMAKLPKMTFAVAEESTCCDKMAAELAEKHSAPIHYVVAEKKFADKAEAMAALAEETETFVTAFVQPKKCEVSGNVTVAGKACSCPVEGEARTKLVAAAVEKVGMKYMVNGEVAACSDCAAAMAKEHSAPIEYVVGEEKTQCPVTARLNLARAKYQAAVQATVTTEKSASDAS